MPDWRDEVSGAIQAWLGTIPAGSKAPVWKQIGMARPEGHGAFVVDLRGARQTHVPEDLETLRLCKERPAGAIGADGSGYRVLDAVLQGEILKVRVAAHVVEHHLRLWACVSPRPTSSNLSGTAWQS